MFENSGRESFGAADYYKTLFEISQIPKIVMAMTTLKFVDCNEAAVRMFGCSGRDEVLGKTPRDFSTPAQYDGEPSETAALRPVREAEEKGFIAFEWRSLRANGEVWDAEVHLTPFTYRGERFAQFILHDVTERKREAEDLRLEQLFSKALLQSLPGIFYLYSYPELRLVRWNKNHETLLGFGPGEIADRDIFAWHLPENRDGVKAAVDVAMTTGFNFIEAPLLRKDGGELHFLLTGTRFESEGKTYLLGFGIDISEKKKAEEENRALYAEMENRVSLRTRQLSEANEALEKALRDLKGTQHQILLSEKMAALGQLIAGIAHELNTPLGAILSSSAVSISVKDVLPEVLAMNHALSPEEEKIFIGLVRQIRSPSTIEEIGELRRLKKHYQTVFEQRGISQARSLAANLADSGCILGDRELETLVNLERFPAVILAAYKLATLYQAGEIIHSAAEKASKVLTALKTYSHHSPEERKTGVNVLQSLELTLTLFHNQLKHGVEVVRRFRPVPDVLVYPDEISHIWMNLVSNALQAMNYRGRLEIEVGETEGEVTVSVIDDGPGVPEEIRGRIFEPFFTTKKPGEGTGLGLDICRRILERIDGRIDFESRPGRTVFTVRLRKDPRP